jgi:hypothetical protein
VHIPEVKHKVRIVVNFPTNRGRSGGLV